MNTYRSATLIALRTIALAGLAMLLILVFLPMAIAQAAIP